MSNRKSEMVSDFLELDDDEPGLSRDENGLTPRNVAYVQAMTSGPTAGNSTKSAEIAGYSKKSAGQIGSRLLKHPPVIAAIDAALRVAIGTELTAEAVAYLRRVLRDETAPPKIRAGIALKLTEASGLLERVQIEKTKETGLVPDGKPGEWSRDDLEKIVRQGAAILTAAAALPPAVQVIDGDVVRNNDHLISQAAE